MCQYLQHTANGVISGKFTTQTLTIIKKQSPTPPKKRPKYTTRKETYFIKIKAKIKENKKVADVINKNPAS